MRNAIFCTLRVLLVMMTILASNSAFATGTLPLHVGDSDDMVSVEMDILRLGDPGYLANNPDIAQLNITFTNNTNKPIQFVVTEPEYGDGMQHPIQITKDMFLPPISDGPTVEDGVTMGAGAVLGLFVPGVLNGAAAKVKYNQKKREVDREVAWNQIINSFFHRKIIPGRTTASGSDYIPTAGDIVFLVVQYMEEGNPNPHYLKIPLTKTVEVAATTPPTP